MAFRPVTMSSLSGGYRTEPNFIETPAKDRPAIVWEMLKKEFVVGNDRGVLTAMLRIEKTCQYPSGDLSVKAQDLFLRLKNVFSPEFKKYGLMAALRTGSGADFMKLQSIRNQRAEKDLCSIWKRLENKFRAIGAFDSRPAPEKFLQVKFWLSSDANLIYINQITDLDLSELEISTLPHEIFRLKALEYLQLASDFFTTFPYDMSEFPQLKKYSFYENVRLKRYDEVKCTLEPGQVLGVRVTVPRNASSAWKQTYELERTETSWVGEIPRGREFSFVCIDHKAKRILDEKTPSVRFVPINDEKQGRTFFGWDVQF